MAKSAFCILLLVLAAGKASLAGSKSNFPRIIVSAQFVMVTTPSGSELSTDVLPEDRQALFDIQDALRKWKRYKLVYKPEEADLILVVRKGRTVTVRSGVQVHGPSAGSARTGALIGADVGPAIDLLEIHRADWGLDSAPLWRALERDGLKAPEVSLFQKFKTEVEEAAKQQP